jgi:hypothetical protein
MLDRGDARLACRGRLLSGFSVCSSSTGTLAATTSGYTRSDGGSFITDGFRPGMEFLTTGFAANGYRVVKGVTASTITTFDTLTAETSSSGRSLTVALPETRIWENQKPTRSGVIIEAPTAGRPYVDEQFVAATHRARTMGSTTTHRADETGMYVLNWYGVSGLGPDGIDDCAQAVLERFLPRTAITVGSDVMRVSGETAPWADQIRPLSNGWSVVTVRIPWYAETTNLAVA